MAKNIEGNMKKLVFESMHNNLGNDFERLSSFFKNIVDGQYDCVVIISRRCYVIFLMFAILYDWNLDNVITDLGIFPNRKKLLVCKNIIVVDDIGYTGNSMQSVLERIRKYVPVYCKINAWLYAVNKRLAKNVLNIKLNFITRISVKCQCQLIDSQCNKLSIALVSAILEAGMPYTTFVYPVWGEVVQELRNNFNLLPSQNKDISFKEQKWKTQYLKIEDDLNIQWVNDISKYSCVRIYRATKDKNLEYFLPFLFLKGIKESKVYTWFSCIADSFRTLGENKMAEEIDEALKTKAKWRKDAIEYLACMMSCFCSKAVAETLNLEKYLDGSNIEIENSFRGSFSANAVYVFNECDSHFASSFFELFYNRIGTLNEVFSDNVEKADRCYLQLKEFVLQNYENMDVYEMTRSIFKWLKSHDSDRAFNKHQTKALRLDDIVSILNEVANYDIESIYLAQIESWDVGIATYRFSYEQKEGIVAKCSAGEISSVLFILKYKDLVRQFIKGVYDNQLNNELKTQDDILKEIYQTAINEKQFTVQEIDTFKQIIKERNGSIYGLLI